MRFDPETNGICRVKHLGNRSFNCREAHPSSINIGNRCIARFFERFSRFRASDRPANSSLTPLFNPSRGLGGGRSTSRPEHNRRAANFDRLCNSFLEDYKLEFLE